MITNQESPQTNFRPLWEPQSALWGFISMPQSLWGAWPVFPWALFHPKNPLDLVDTRCRDHCSTFHDREKYLLLSYLPLLWNPVYCW